MSNYSKLNKHEKLQKLAEIGHALENFPTMEKVIDDMLELAKKRGVFKNVKIMPVTDTDINDVPLQHY